MTTEIIDNLGKNAEFKLVKARTTGMFRKKLIIRLISHLRAQSTLGYVNATFLFLIAVKFGLINSQSLLNEFHKD